MVHYGKIIILEKNLSEEEKTIKSTYLVGYGAGGEKFILPSIMFKFATSKNIYKDGDEAHKASGHELKGLRAFMNGLEFGSRKWFQLCDCRYPMTTIIDYLGYIYYLYFNILLIFIFFLCFIYFYLFLLLFIIYLFSNNLDTD